MIARSSEPLRGWFLVWDLVAVAAAWVAADVLRLRLGVLPIYAPDSPAFELCLGQLPLVVLIAAVAFRLAHMYEVTRLSRAREELAHVVKGVGFLALLTVAITFAMQSPYRPRGVLALFPVHGGGGGDARPAAVVVGARPVAPAAGTTRATPSSSATAGSPGRRRGRSPRWRGPAFRPSRSWTTTPPRGTHSCPSSGRSTTCRGWCTTCTSSTSSSPCRCPATATCGGCSTCFRKHWSKSASSPTRRRCRPCR